MSPMPLITTAPPPIDQVFAVVAVGVPVCLAADRGVILAKARLDRGRALRMLEGYFQFAMQLVGEIA